jgi:acyl CoA:acetate/3-ketoacid CoA transferase beta subunit
MPGRGVTAVITDLGILEPDPETCELVLTLVHPGVTANQVREATAWALRVAEPLEECRPPSGGELEALRRLRPAGSEEGA